VGPPPGTRVRADPGPQHRFRGDRHERALVPGRPGPSRVPGQVPQAQGQGCRDEGHGGQCRPPRRARPPGGPVDLPEQLVRVRLRVPVRGGTESRGEAQEAFVPDRAGVRGLRAPHRGRPVGLPEIDLGGRNPKEMSDLVAGQPFPQPQEPARPADAGAAGARTPGRRGRDGPGPRGAPGRGDRGRRRGGRSSLAATASARGETAAVLNCWRTKWSGPASWSRQSHSRHNLVRALRSSSIGPAGIGQQAPGQPEQVGRPGPDVGIGIGRSPAGADRREAGARPGRVRSGTCLS